MPTGDCFPGVVSIEFFARSALSFFCNFLIVAFFSATSLAYLLPFAIALILKSSNLSLVTFDYARQALYTSLIFFSSFSSAVTLSSSEVFIVSA